MIRDTTFLAWWRTESFGLVACGFAPLTLGEAMRVWRDRNSFGEQ